MKKSDQIILWTSGGKGYMVQQPLLVALNQQLKVLAVTSTANVYLQNIKENAWLLTTIETPKNLKSLLAFVFHLLSNRKKLRQQLMKHGKLVHVIMYSPWDIFFLGAVKKAGLPLIITIHDAVQHVGEESWFMDKLRQWCIDKADHITVLSQHVAQTLQTNLKVSKPIHVLEDGLVMRVEPALEARLYPDQQPLKLLFHGRIHAYKGLDLLLDALLLLQSQGLNYPLTIAGAGDLGPYQSKILQLNNILIHNQFMSDEELLGTLAAHDICVLPYIEASQSAVAVDALWAALPSIATPIGALPKQLKHGIDALLLESLDAKALAQAIHQLCGDKLLYESLSKGAHASYQSNGPEKAAKQWAQLYNLITENGKQ